LCCSDFKRHDNFTHIGICPKTNVQPRKLQLSDMNDDETGKLSFISTDLQGAAKKVAP